MIINVNIRQKMRIALTEYVLSILQLLQTCILSYSIAFFRARQQDRATWSRFSIRRDVSWQSSLVSPVRFIRLCRLCRMTVWNFIWRDRMGGMSRTSKKYHRCFYLLGKYRMPRVSVPVTLWLCREIFRGTYSQACNAHVWLDEWILYTQIFESHESASKSCVNSNYRLTKYQ